MTASKLGLIAAVIAAVALSGCQSEHRASDTTLSPVLVAKKLIRKGTRGEDIGATGNYRVVNITTSAIRSGAIINPSSLIGKVAVVNILPGEQLNADYFVPAKDYHSGTVTLPNPGPTGVLPR